MDTFSFKTNKLIRLSLVDQEVLTLSERMIHDRVLLFVFFFPFCIAFLIRNSPDYI